MQQYIVTVGENEIAQGTRLSCSRCMVALGARRSCGLQDVSVDYFSRDAGGPMYLRMMFTREGDKRPGQRRAIAQDTDAVLRTVHWDYGADVEPFVVVFTEVDYAA
jgi:hypothetical protein